MSLGLRVMGLPAFRSSSRREFRSSRARASRVSARRSIHYFGANRPIRAGRSIAATRLSLRLKPLCRRTLNMNREGLSHSSRIGCRCERLAPCVHCRCLRDMIAFAAERMVRLVRPVSYLEAADMFKDLGAKVGETAGLNLDGHFAA